MGEIIPFPVKREPPLSPAMEQWVDENERLLANRHDMASEDKARARKVYMGIARLFSPASEGETIDRIRPR